MIKFLDFDGVIVNSIDECYEVSKDVYFKDKDFLFDEAGYKLLFYKYRGLVRPVYEYSVLHSSIELFIKDSSQDFNKLFKKELSRQSSDERAIFEDNFFKKRLFFQNNDFKNWIKMNPLMPFGEGLIGEDNSNIVIITTKNKESTEVILNYYEIKVNKVYANDDIKFFSNKGNLISHLMNKFAIDEAIFIDDSVEHLDTVKDSRVHCYFAGWGYGLNTDYPIYIN